MGFRFFKRIRVAPGMTLNLSKGGGSMSFGPRGAKVTAGGRGIRKTVGLPGTGLYYTSQNSGKKAASSQGARGRRKKQAASPVTLEQRLTLGFFEGLFIGKDERHFVEGMKALLKGNESEALSEFGKALHIADSAFMAGFTALKQERPRQAIAALRAARLHHRQLGKYFAKYGIVANMQMPVTEEITAHIEPTHRGVLLGLVEACQELEDYKNAVEVLKVLRRMAPEDVVVKLSLAELLLEAKPGHRGICNSIVRMTADIRNESPAHAGLMLYKARALRTLGLDSAARTTLTAALRRKKNCSAVLLTALRYERALAYEGLNQVGRARADYEKIYAENPDYEDVAKKLAV